MAQNTTDHILKVMDMVSKYASDKDIPVALAAPQEDALAAPLVIVAARRPLITITRITARVSVSNVEVLFSRYPVKYGLAE